MVTEPAPSPVLTVTDWVVSPVADTGSVAFPTDVIGADEVEVEVGVDPGDPPLPPLLLSLPGVAVAVGVLPPATERSRRVVVPGVKVAVSCAACPLTRKAIVSPARSPVASTSRRVPSYRLELPYSPATVVSIESNSVSPMTATMTVPAGAGEPPIVTVP
jgi:hypothetical protein